MHFDIISIIIGNGPIFISQDPRFDASIDQRTGYRTNSVLCMPVCNFEGEVIGVAEIINKKNGTNEFTIQDVEV